MGCVASKAPRKIDFDDEARALWRALNVADPSQRYAHYTPLDPIWPEPEVVFPGGRERLRGTPPAAPAIYVGNQAASRDDEVLRAHGITHIVNCTAKLPFYHVGVFQYLRLDVVQAPTRRRGRLQDRELLAWSKTLFDFVDEALSAGGSVLVHCMAGAHRAGTAGCLLLMHLTGAGAREATRVAKSRRSCIDPIAAPELLLLFEEARRHAESKARRPTPEEASSASWMQASGLRRSMSSPAKATSEGNWHKEAPFSPPAARAWDRVMASPTAEWGQQHRGAR